MIARSWDQVGEASTPDGEGDPGRPGRMEEGGYGYFHRESLCLSHPTPFFGTLQHTGGKVERR